MKSTATSSSSGAGVGLQSFAELIGTMLAHHHLWLSVSCSVTGFFVPSFGTMFIAADNALSGFVCLVSPLCDIALWLAHVSKLARCVPHDHFGGPVIAHIDHSLVSFLHF